MTESTLPLVEMSPGGCRLSSLVQGYWRLADWGLDARDLLDFVHRHVDLGVTTVDHAAVYGEYRCEAMFGQALKLDPGLRDRLQIVSKFDIHIPSSRFPECRFKHYDTGAAAVRDSVEASLTQLGTDRLDLLLVHRPDPLLDARELAGTFEALAAEGKVLHFGVSNFTPFQFDLLQSAMDVPLATNQVEINPLNDTVIWDGSLDQLQRLQTRPMAWSCLAGGRIFDTGDARGHALRVELEAVGDEIGASGPDQVAYAWALRLPSKPVPIIGSGNIERVATAVGALSLDMTREQWFRILAAGQGREVP